MRHTAARRWPLSIQHTAVLPRSVQHCWRASDLENITRSLPAWAARRSRRGVLKEKNSLAAGPWLHGPLVAGVHHKLRRRLHAADESHTSRSLTLISSSALLDFNRLQPANGRRRVSSHSSPLSTRTVPCAARTPRRRSVRPAPRRPAQAETCTRARYTTHPQTRTRTRSRRESTQRKCKRKQRLCAARCHASLC